jgi:hypothetical protein
MLDAVATVSDPAKVDPTFAELVDPSAIAKKQNEERP